MLPTSIDEPPARNTKRRERRQRPMHIFIRGQWRTFHTKAELTAYIASMRARK